MLILILTLYQTSWVIIAYKFISCGISFLQATVACKKLILSPIAFYKGSILSPFATLLDKRKFDSIFSGFFCLLAVLLFRSCCLSNCITEKETLGYGMVDWSSHTELEGKENSVVSDRWCWLTCEQILSWHFSSWSQESLLEY